MRPAACLTDWLAHRGAQAWGGRSALTSFFCVANEGCNDYHPMFFTHDRAWEEFFCVCIQLLNKTWKEMRATAEDFNKVRWAWTGLFWPAVTETRCIFITSKFIQLKRRTAMRPRQLRHSSSTHNNPKLFSVLFMFCYQHFDWILWVMGQYLRKYSPNKSRTLCWILISKAKV